jgi:putative ABC transport system permease protein
LVLRQGVSMTVIGIVIGIAGASAASAALSTLLFGISRVDPITYAVVCALLLAVATLASVLPALRAARVDPASTLRSE